MYLSDKKSDKYMNIYEYQNICSPPETQAKREHNFKMGNKSK